MARVGHALAGPDHKEVRLPHSSRALDRFTRRKFTFSMLYYLYLTIFSPESVLFWGVGSLLAGASWLPVL